MIFLSTEIQMAAEHFAPIFERMKWTYGLIDPNNAYTIPNTTELVSTLTRLVDVLVKHPDIATVASGRFEVSKLRNELIAIRLEPSSEILLDFETELEEHGSLCDDEIYKYFIDYIPPGE